MDRLMADYLPPILQDYQEFQALTGRYQLVFDELWDLEGGTEADMFLTTAGERGLAHWEAIFRIEPEEGDDLERRRQRVFTRLGQVTPYSWPAFLAFLTALAGDEAAFAAELDGLTLTIYVMPHWRELAGAVYSLVAQMVPANIETAVILVYNAHDDLSRMTHGELGAYTHGELHSEVDLFG